MAEAIRMPKMSDTMEEGVIVKWSVKVGDKVKSGDILAEVETDKATMDMESYYDGVVLHLAVNEGQAAPIDAVIAVIGEKGEDFQSLLSSGGAPSVKEETKEDAPAASKEKVDVSDINAVVARMPLLTDTMEEGVIHKWLKKVGDTVKSGDALAEVETDKATMEIEAYEDGTLLHILIGDGESVPVNGIIAVIGEKGADYETLIKAESGGAASQPAQKESVTETPAKTEIVAAEVSPSSTSDGRVFASPLAKKIAKDKGIDLLQVKGSGENGRIIKADVENFVPAVAPTSIPSSASKEAAIPMPVGVESYDEIPLTQMRKAIARSLSTSQTTAVDFSVTMEINMDNAMKARKAMNEASPVKISFNDMVLKACAAALRKHPEVNSSWREDHIRRNHHIHIGMAVAVESGLIVPVIRFVDTLPLSAIAAATKALGNKAKEGKLQPADWEGNTFTVSNLGMMGVDSFNSIINNPKNESCILSVGAIKETVAVKDGQFYATNIMKVTLTCDHRVVDGALGAGFLVTLKEYLEEPYKLLV